ncbi:MAG: alpha-amylase [Promethearchaeota archaeon]|nr:MAG: alpha-amylase [Candidatus Lokiarchaeota archaeon]
MMETEINWPKHPRILEINTWPWLNSLSEQYNTPINLNNIPDEILDNNFSLFDVIWLMGVWERSPKSRKIAIEHPDLQIEYRKALNEFKAEDVVGSPYSIHYYRVDNHLGGNEGLISFRKKLKDRGLLLILDYVPNHVAIDHLWTLLKSNVFIKGNQEDLTSHPQEFFTVVDQVYAHGRDPYFLPWTDTIQINAFSSEAREKAIFTLLDIAQLCNGVRCDMAMLMTNKVFIQTWGERAGLPPETEFWVAVIDSVRDKFPEFKFLAEVYWGMEWDLQQQGFDFCYDKTLYDRLLYDDAQSVKGHLQAAWDYQKKLLRFIENHDEKRAIEAFGEDKSQAAAILALTLPGARLIHEGQMMGYNIKLPVQLGRRLNEEKNMDLLLFYQNLLKAGPGKYFSEGNWELLNIDPVNNYDISSANLIAYQWGLENNYRVIIVNFSKYFSRGHVRLKNLDYTINAYEFIDLLNHKQYTHKNENLEKYGLYTELTPWSGHIFSIKEIN